VQLRDCLSLLFSEKKICPNLCLSSPASKCVKLLAWKENTPFSQITRWDNFQALDRCIEYRDLKIPWTRPRRTTTGSKFGQPNLKDCFSRAKVAVAIHVLVATPLQLKKPVSGATCLKNSWCVFVFKGTLGARDFSCAVYSFGQVTSAALDHRTREKTSGAQCSLRVKNVTMRHRMVMLTKNSSTKTRKND